MPVMDEFREERAALRNAPLKEKLSYFLYYYKWHLIVAAAVILFAATLTSQILSRRETAFYLALVNSIDTKSDELAEYNFTEYSEIDTDKSVIVYDTSMYINFDAFDELTINSAEKFITYLAAAELDVVVSDESVIKKYAHNEAFYDLRQLLSPRQLEEWASCFYYMDYSVVEAINAAQDSYNYDFIPEYPDPRRPEDMEKPVPVGIYVDGCHALSDRFLFTRAGDSGVILSVVLNSRHLDMVSRYIDFLMDSRTVPEQ